MYCPLSDRGTIRELPMFLLACLKLFQVLVASLLSFHQAPSRTNTKRRSGKETPGSLLFCDSFTAAAMNIALQSLWSPELS